MNVSLGLPGDPVLFTPLQQHIAVLGAVNYVLTKSLDEYPRELVLSDDQRLTLLAVLEQIVKFLIINLQERAIDSETQLGVLH